MKTTNTLELQRSTPEAQGIASAAILSFVRAVEELSPHPHSLMLLRHGAVVAEGWWAPCAAEHPHMLFSLSKSFTATAVGMAVAEGHFTVEDRVLSFFPDEAPAELSDNLAAMRVQNLLSMVTGHAEDTLGYLFQRQDDNWVKAFLERPVEYAPGTHFLYNTGATYMLSAIVQKVTGLTLLEYLQPHLFAPLGIEHAAWESCPRGINTGGWGLSIRTEDIARFGQLYLQKGIWHGERLIAEDWVEAASSAQVSNGSDAESDWQQGYGYQFWRCRHGAYRGDGAFGQFCVVLPAQDAVLAFTSGIGNMQGVLNLLWALLLPAMGPVALPEDVQAQVELTQTLANLTLPTVAGALSSPMAASVSGQTYVFTDNEHQLEALTCHFTEDQLNLTLRNDRGEMQFACGHGRWIKSAVMLDASFFNRMDPHPTPQWAAANGAWTDDNTYTINLSFYETPFCLTLTCHFEADTLLLNNKVNVSFDATELPPLVGRRCKGTAPRQAGL